MIPPNFGGPSAREGNGFTPWRIISDDHSVPQLVLNYEPIKLRQGGVGGWRERQHDRGKASIEWVGTPSHTISLELFFDSLRQTRRDVENDLAILQVMALPTGGGEPSPVRLSWGDGQQQRWVVNDITYTSTLRHENRRVQARATVELLEHTTAALALTPVEQAAADSDATPATERTVTVQSGENLMGIAQRELGSAGRSAEIATLNKLADPDLITVGQVLKLPAT